MTKDPIITGHICIMVKCNLHLLFAQDLLHSLVLVADSIQYVLTEMTHAIDGRQHFVNISKS